MSGLFPGARVTDLVPGNPSALDDLARQLRTLGGGLNDAANSLSGLNDGQWVGDAADGFRRVVGRQPAQYGRAGSAFFTAASGIQSFAQVMSPLCQARVRRS
jgi:hypothetical protein